MQKLSNTKLLPIITRLLILLLLAKIIAIGVWWYLPSDGIELLAQKSYQAKYQRVDFKNMLIKAKVAQAPTTQTTKSAAYSINSLVLKGLYGSRFHGFAIVAKKAAPQKTTIVSVGEVYAGYKLKEIQLSQVVFTKSAKEYILALGQKTTNNKSRITRNAPTRGSEVSEEQTVSRSDIQHYSNNPQQLWKEIAIAPVKRNGKIQGFRINRLNPNSKLATLGVKKGDLIIRANNVALTSFSAALGLYQNIAKIDTISLVVLRNNQEKEIIYEIH